ncbi:MAG: ABC transporter permease [Acidimicrobiales bacterium]
MRQDQGVSPALDSGAVSPSSPSSPTSPAPTASAHAPSEPEAGHLPPSGLRRFVDLHLQELVVTAVALALVLFFTVDSPYFFTSANAEALAAFIAPIAFFALAEVPILILGEIDLSVGEVYVLSPFVVEYFNNHGVPLALAIVLTLVVCAGIGWFNGLVTFKLHIPSFITTLGVTFALEGIILISSNGAPANPVGSGTLVLWLGGAVWAETYWALATLLLLHVMLRRTTFGLHTVAVGGNSESSRESGIKVDYTKIWCFVLCAFIGGLIGILDGYHIGSIDPDTPGLTFTFYGIAAAVIGGTALTGGRGTMIGATIGSIVLGILEDGFHVISISSFAYDLILGIAILVAMVLNVQIERASIRGAGHGSFARFLEAIFGRRRKVETRQ